MTHEEETENVLYGSQEFEEDQDHGFYDDSDVDSQLEEALMNCGMLQDGTCMKAGSEECDWDCPFS